MNVNITIPIIDIPKTKINIVLALVLSDNIPTTQVRTKANVIEVPFNLELMALA